MNKYKIWRCDNSGQLLIEIYDEEDLVEIQKEWLNKGWFIIKYEFCFDNIFMLIGRSRKEG